MHVYQPESNLLCVKKRKERKSRFQKSADLFCTSNMIPNLLFLFWTSQHKIPSQPGCVSKSVYLSGNVCPCFKNRALNVRLFSFFNDDLLACCKSIVFKSFKDKKSKKAHLICNNVFVFVTLSGEVVSVCMCALKLSWNFEPVNGRMQVGGDYSGRGVLKKGGGVCEILTISDAIDFDFMDKL